MALKALIFDVDGTLAETEEAHRLAFNQAFAEAGHDWIWDAALYRLLLRVTGGRERIGHFLDSSDIVLPDRDDAIAAIHIRKNAIYAERVADGCVALRPGVERLMREACEACVAVAIATTTSRANVDALIDATPLRSVNFSAFATAEDVTRKKPDPEVYRVALDRLSLDASECIAVEDSENGLRAALAANIATVVTPGFYTDDGNFTGARLLTPDLDAVTAGGGPVDLRTLRVLLDNER